MSTKIVITGANGHVGQAVLRKLWDTSAESFAVTRVQASLQATRVFTCSLEADRVQRCIRQADAVIHLAGTLFPQTSNSYYGANVATTAAVLKAARDSNVKRIVFLSYIDADPASSNEYLKTKGQAEELLQSTGIPTVVFRSTHIIGGPQCPGPTAGSLLSTDGEPVKVLGTGNQLVAPVYVEDAATAIVSAVEKGRAGVYELCGPDRMSMNDLVKVLNRSKDVAMRHLPGRLAKFLAKVTPNLPPPLVEVMLRQSIGNPALAMTEFGFSLTSLMNVWNVGAPSETGVQPLNQEVSLT